MQTRIVNFRDLSPTTLISDLKEAATCDVKTVCRLPCHRCPHVIERINEKKIRLKFLNSYTVKLVKKEDGQLVVYIAAPNIDNWLKINKVAFTTLNRHEKEKLSVP